MKKTTSIPRKDLKESLKNGNIAWLRNFFSNLDRDNAMSAINVKEHVDILNKNNDLDFLFKLFKEIEVLKFNPVNQKFLDISRKLINLNDGHYLVRNSDINFKSFITKIVNDKLSKQKNFDEKDIECLFKIKESFDLSKTQLLKILIKLTEKSKTDFAIGLIDLVVKSNLLENKKDKAVYIESLINRVESIRVFDKLYEVFNKDMHEMYLDKVANGKIWDGLTPKTRFGRYFNLPNILDSKLNWLDNKGLGYLNHELPYVILGLREKFSMDVILGKDEFGNLVNEVKNEKIFNCIVKAVKLDDDYRQKVLDFIKQDKELSVIFTDELFSNNPLILKSFSINNISNEHVVVFAKYSSNMSENIQNGVIVKCIESAQKKIKEQVLKLDGESDLVKIMTTFDDEKFKEACEKIIFKNDLNYVVDKHVKDVERKVNKAKI